MGPWQALAPVKAAHVKLNVKFAAEPDCASRPPFDVDHQMVHSWRASQLDDAVQISVSDAKGQLTELVRRAEAGDEIILTRHGRSVARLVPIKPVPEPKERRKLLEAARKSGAAKATAGPDAARSQDFLYGEDGLPK
jgi:prevent-host-death family protein